MTDPDHANGWSPEFGARLSILYDKIGSKKAAAEVAGYSDDQLSNWQTGRSKIPLIAAMRLCVKAGASIDWLCGLKAGDAELRSDARILDAVENSVRYILGAAQFFGRNDPNDIAPATARRALFLLDSTEGNKAQTETRLTQPKKTAFD
jgi:hypothetical protein